MALSTAEADALVKASEEAGKLVTVISQLRFSEDIQKVKRLVAENAFGKISLCNLYMKYYRSPSYYSSSPWKGTLKFDGGGALMNQGIHGVDLLQYLVGGVKHVQGKIATLSHRIEVEDTVVATVELENGALGVIVGSTCAYPGFERRIEIHGETGYAILTENYIAQLMIDGKVVPLKEFSASKTAQDASAVDSECHTLQIENLLDAIEGKAPLLVDCREGKKAVEIIEKIYCSSESQ
jgi:predicted dehydrogenase